MPATRRSPTAPRRAEPQRTCVGCRRTAPAAELVRFVRGPQGPVAGRHLPGRGAWLCRNPGCADLALRRGALARALRMDRSDVEPAVEAVREAVRTEL